MSWCLRRGLAVRSLASGASLVSRCLAPRSSALLSLSRRSIGSAAHLNATATVDAPFSPLPTPLRNEPLHILRLDRDRRTDITQQLRLEEALLRCSTKNYLIVNRLPLDAAPTVVIGISGHPERWCNLDQLQSHDDDSAHRPSVALLQRFSGGGTVLLDPPGALLISLIVNKAALRHIQPYPRSLMSWSAMQYKRAFELLDSQKHPRLNSVEQSTGAASASLASQFSLQGHDYCIGDRKFGGSAQSIVRHRMLHHSSLLFDFNAELMSRCLCMPPLDRQPEYRRQRSHAQFLTSLTQAGVCQRPDQLAEALQNVLAQHEFSHAVETFVDSEDVLFCLTQQHERLLKPLDVAVELERVQNKARLASLDQQSSQQASSG